MVVADINRLTRGVGDRIVRPGRQLIFVAVQRPSKPGAGLRHEKPEPGIRNYVDPGSRRAQTFTENGDILAPIVRETTQAIEQFELTFRQRHIPAFAGTPYGPCRRGRTLPAL